MNDKFKELEAMVEKNGPEQFSVMGNQSKAMSQLWNQLAMQAKEALNLGVLNGPDLAMLKEQIPDPTSWGEATTFNKQDLINRLEVARESLNKL